MYFFIYMNFVGVLRNSNCQACFGQYCISYGSLLWIHKIAMLTTQKEGPWMYYLCLSLEVLSFPSGVHPLIPLQFKNRGKENAMYKYFLSDKHAGLADGRQRIWGGRNPETLKAILVSRRISWRGVSIGEPSQEKTAKERVSRTSAC